MPGRAPGVGDGEVDARILEHPLRVVVLADRRRRCEQLGIEADAAVEVGDVEVYVEAIHFEAPFLRGLQGEDTGSHAPEPAQQFSVR